MIVKELIDALLHKDYQDKRVGIMDNSGLYEGVLSIASDKSEDSVLLKSESYTDIEEELKINLHEMTAEGFLNFLIDAGISWRTVKECTDADSFIKIKDAAQRLGLKDAIPATGGGMKVENLICHLREQEQNAAVFIEQCSVELSKVKLNASDGSVALVSA